MHCSADQLLISLKMDTCILKKENDDLLQQDIDAAYTEFVRALDRWIQLLVIQGRYDRAIIEKVKSSISRNIQSNIDYYRKLGAESDKAEDYKHAGRYKLLEKVYREICN